MNKINLKAWFVFLLLVFSVKVLAGPGDSLIIKAIDFSQRGDVKENWIVFPDTSYHSQKILMYYTLKCDPLNTPYKCGEWDYLTYTYASKKTGSFQKFPNFKVDGNQLDSFFYMKDPSWSYTPHFEYNTIHTDTFSVFQTKIEDTLNRSVVNFSNGLKFSKNSFLWKKSQLISAGLTKFPLKGISLNFSNTTSPGRIMIRMALSKRDSINQTSNDSFQVVYDMNTTISSSGYHYFPFHQDFLWDSTSNIVIEILLFNNSGSLSLVMNPVSFQAGSYSVSDDYSLLFENQDFITVPKQVFSTLTNQVTFAFWQYGNPKFQPQNNTIFEGIDSTNKRIFNVHAPYSDANIYWDCGNDGSGYDRINKVADTSLFKGKWNFWTFTKNTTTGEMKAYVNGTLFMSGTSKTKGFRSIKTFKIGSNANSNGGFYDGMIDEFSVWNKALDAADIFKIMQNPPKTGDPLYSNLLLWLPFSEGSGNTMNDISSNHYTAYSNKGPGWKKQSPLYLFKNFETVQKLPEIIFDQSLYKSSVVRSTVTDSFENQTNMLILFSNFSKPDIATDTLFVFPTYKRVIFDSTGSIVNLIPVQPDSMLFKVMTEARYDEKFRIMDRYEIGRYITPYGINLDLGPGFTWIYDISDYAPILHDSVRINSGNWQELQELKFVFIEGTPPRNVLDVKTVYSGSYQLNNLVNAVPAKKLAINPQAFEFRVKTRTTGHGMAAPNNCAEFCPKNHELWINDTMRYKWMLWTECASNPLYPQGGTWIYDRAGWCPGSPVYVYDWEITDFVNESDSLKIDYNAEGDQGGNFVLETQLISYGKKNFKTDAAITDMVYPVKDQVYFRQNPACGNPLVVVQNTGRDTIKTIEFDYGKPTGTYTAQYKWKGNLVFGQTQEIELPFYWGGWTGDSTFRITITNVNGKPDDYNANNTILRQFTIPALFPNQIVLQLRTNSAASETSYQLADAGGKVLYSRNSMANNTLYKDTFNLPNTYGCYKFTIFDTDGDGLSFWNNNDGSGYARFRSMSGTLLKNFNPDFGNEVSMSFTTGWLLDKNEPENLPENKLSVFPNPGTGLFNFEIELNNGQDATFSVFDMKGREIYLQQLKTPTTELLKIDLSDQPNGLYFAKITTSSGVLVQKINLIK